VTARHSSYLWREPSDAICMLIYESAQGFAARRMSATTPTLGRGEPTTKRSWSPAYTLGETRLKFLTLRRPCGLRMPNDSSKMAPTQIRRNNSPDSSFWNFPHLTRHSIGRRVVQRRPVGPWRFAPCRQNPSGGLRFERSRPAGWAHLLQRLGRVREAFSVPSTWQSASAKTSP